MEWVWRPREAPPPVFLAAHSTLTRTALQSPFMTHALSIWRLEMPCVRNYPPPRPHISPYTSGNSLLRLKIT